MRIENAFDVNAPPNRVYPVTVAYDGQAPPVAKPVNAIGLLFSILIEHIRGWFGR